MEARFSYDKAAPGVYKAMIGVEQYLENCGLEESLLHLIRLRASQINGCAYCLDMHWKDLRAIGEQEQRLYSLGAWRECPYYTERERAALAWTEAVTLINTGHVPDTVYEEAHAHFSEKELSDLTFAVPPSTRGTGCQLRPVQSRELTVLPKPTHWKKGRRREQESHSPVRVAQIALGAIVR
jgi:AhpD family alkylhydroperoxidase